MDLMEYHHFWILSMVSPLRFMEEKCLVDFDAFNGFSDDFSSGHFMILALGCSEYEEGLFDVMTDSFISR